MRLITILKVLARCLGVIEELKMNSSKRTSLAEIYATIEEYGEVLDILTRYDEDNLEINYEDDVDKLASLEYDEAVEIINVVKKKLQDDGEKVGLFGVEKEVSLRGILGNVVQTFDGVPIYHSNEERAAHLLYEVIKANPFYEGNKRIACILFLIYLRKAGIYSRRITKDGVTPITLMIAESMPHQKDIMINLILNLLREEHY